MSAYSREFGNSKPPTQKLVRSVKSRVKATPQEVREKQNRAVDLRRAGASYNEIASALGYNDASAARKSVEAAIRKFEFEATKDVLLMDLARLDEYLKLATHRLRTSGDLSQIDRCMRIIDKKHWMLGVTPASLAEANESGDAKTPGGMNVVIAASERTFIRSMMAAVGMDPDSPEGRAYLASKNLGDEKALPAAEKKPTEKKTGGKRLKKKPTHKPSTQAPAHIVTDVIDAEVVDEAITQHEKDAQEARAISTRSLVSDDVSGEILKLNSQRI